MASPARPWLTLAAALLAVSAGCGARSDLPVGGRGGATSSSSTAAGGSGQGGGGAPPAPCTFVSAGAPLELLSFASGDAGGPDLAVIDPGLAGAAARVLHQAIDEDANFWHPELRVADYTIGAPWPGGVVAGHSPWLVGIDAHAWGRIAPQRGAPGRIGLLWYHGDLASPAVTPGVKFRVLDVAGWSAGEEVFVDPEGEAVFTLAPGASAGGSDEGYHGDGYVAEWRAPINESAVTTRIAVLDPSGQVMAGPLPVTPELPYPGRSADAVWAGSTYLVSTSYDDTCPSGAEPPCTPDAVVISELGPPGAVPASLAQTATIPVAVAGTVPFRPRLGRYGDAIFVAWSEGASDGKGTRTVRLARLDAAGALAGEPVTLADGRQLLVPVAVAVTEMGAVVAWIEPGDPTASPGTVGFARLVAQPTALDGSLGPTIEIPVTSPTETIAMAAIATPRALLLSWASAKVASGSSPQVTYLARLDCVP